MNRNNFNDPECVREAQDMLRAIGIIYGIDALRIPSGGVFDAVTEAAVREFQSIYSLPLTGEIDLLTWETLRLESDIAGASVGPRRSISPYVDGRTEAAVRGDVGELVYIIQLMLNAVSLYYDLPPVPISGIFDEATSNAVITFQNANVISATGDVDYTTWDLLAEEYDLAVRDSQ